MEFSTTENNPVVNIKVIGVGGGGNNAVNRMINSNLQGVQFIAVNTDKQVLLINKAPTRLQIGIKRTKGHGAGDDPEIGRISAEESKPSIMEALQDADLLFITAGMGGGTGTGAAPVIAQIAKEMGILTVGVVTKPFEFEGPVRMRHAEEGIRNLRKFVDTIIIIPNEKLLDVLPESASIVQCYMYADEALRQAIKGVTEVILRPGYINVDFADVRKILKNNEAVGPGRRAHMGIGRAKGDNKVIQALQQAVSSPLLETSIEGASGLLIYYHTNANETIREISKATNLVRGVVSKDCEIIFGQGIDESMGDEVEITLIATGLQEVGEKVANDDPFNYTSEVASQPYQQEIFTPKEEITAKLFNNIKRAEAEYNEMQEKSEVEDVNDDLTIDDDTPPFLKALEKARNKKD